MPLQLRTAIEVKVSIIDAITNDNSTTQQRTFAFDLY